MNVQHVQSWWLSLIPAIERVRKQFPALSKERSSLSITALNGLRAVEDGVRNEGGLSKVAVNKGMLVSVKSSHKAYLAHIEEERKNED